MFMGYFGDPESTLAAWRNLWFHTGDRGWFDADGDLWFSDRIGDVIRRLGEFVSSYEVEQAVVAHPDVQLAAAFGVPSDLIEEEVMLAVLAREGSRVEPQALRGWCAERLPRHAVPRFVELVKELPMTPTGKIEKFKLRERGVTAATDDARAAREVLQ
jgi:crotonobetaine/carnitine-CoA ligase